ncbi:MAG: class I SAM-dependent methyltransferase [Ardenticatenaceae bacterium]|nr:class I SAM-dependent methyltransferase [Ardenticatenaceae bacterium]
MDSTKRFSDRVDNYVLYRPGYPTAVLDLLRDECGLTETAVIADIGSGTGILTQLFLQNGNPVYGVEPNDDMRAAAESQLSEYAHFTSVNGRAEATTLPDHCADFATAGQAFHWFEPQAAKDEFQRILKPDGWVALIWNTRDKKSPFMKEYERLLDQYAIGYQETKQTRSHERIPPFLGGEPAIGEFPNEQIFDWKGLLGRSLSSSYAPLPGHPAYEPLLAGLRRLFLDFADDGRVRFSYTTRVYYGRIH